MRNLPSRKAIPRFVCHLAGSLAGVMALIAFCSGALAAASAVDTDFQRLLTSAKEKSAPKSPEIQLAATATDIWIDQVNGVNSGTTPGTEAQPFKSITYALLSMADRAVPDPWNVHIRAGNYDADPAKPIPEREVFPVQIRPGMALVGEDGPTSCIISGEYNGNSPDPILKGGSVWGVRIAGLTLKKMRVPDGSGGAVQLTSTSGRIENCVFRENYARFGGAVYLTLYSEGTFHFVDNQFIGNMARKDQCYNWSYGGAIYVDGDYRGSLAGNLFQSNTAYACGDYGEGGAIRIAGSLTGEMLNNRFQGNSANYCGALRIAGGMSGTLGGNVFDANSTGRQGGAIYMSWFSGTFADNVFRRNSADETGGAWIRGSFTGEISGNVFSENSSNWHGAALRIDTFRGVIRDNTFMRNTVNRTDSDGGACHIGVSAGTQADVFGNVFVENYAARNGGGLAIGPATNISENVFIRNSAGGVGGGLILGAAGQTPANVASNLFLYCSRNALYSSQNVNLLNNTFYGGKGAFSQPNVVIDTNAPACTLRNNIFAELENAVYLSGTPDFPFTHNNFNNCANFVSRNDQPLGTDLTFIGLQLLNFKNNADWAPGLAGENVDSGVWSVDAAFDEGKRVTVLTDAAKNWREGQWGGAILDVSQDPNTHQQFLILDNTATQLFVKGDILWTKRTAQGAAYTIDDFHLAAGSQNIDAGAQVGIPWDFEFDLRPIGAGFDIGADEAGGPVEALAVRGLPGGYCMDNALQVRLTVNINERRMPNAVAVEDQPPAGWTVSNISDGGVWDSVNGKVKWGPWTAPDDLRDRALTYTVTPPQDASGTLAFAGQISADGINHPLSGKVELNPSCCLHPMDANADGRITLDEVTAYAAAWKTGQADDCISCVTEGAALWKQGEVYHCTGTPATEPCYSCGQGNFVPGP